MGLDWVLTRRKPKRGKTKEFTALEKKRFARREAGASEEELADLEAKLDAVSIRAEEVIGAPRIGIDEQATLWWREHVYAPHFERAVLGGGRPEYLAHWKRPQAELLREAHGKFVCELATEQGGRVEGGNPSRSSPTSTTPASAFSARRASSSSATSPPRRGSTTTRRTLPATRRSCAPLRSRRSRRVNSRNTPPSSSP